MISRAFWHFRLRLCPLKNSMRAKGTSGEIPLSLSTVPEAAALRTRHRSSQPLDR